MTHNDNKRQNEDELIFVVEKIVAGGMGLARGPDGVVFIPAVLAGEQVSARITKKKKGYQEAQLIRIISPSPHRIQALCKHYGICGGCDLMHASYQEQLRIKKSIFLDTMLRQGPWNRQDNSIEDLDIVAGNEFEYRSRFRFSITKAGLAGLQAKQSNTTIQLDDCPIAHPKIRNWIREKNIIKAQTRQTSTIDDDEQSGEYPIFATDEALFIAGQTWQISLHGKSLIFDSDSFFQSNLAMLSKLLEWLKLRLAGRLTTPIKAIIDLYGGVGTFSALLWQEGSSVLVVDTNLSNIEHAKSNTKDIAAQLFLGSVDQWLASNDSSKYLQENDEIILVLDPPRSGLSKNLVEAMTSIKPSLIIYVSCNPTSFARDAKAIIEQGFQLVDLKLFDFYPQTWHIESAAIFTRGFLEA